MSRGTCAPPNPASHAGELLKSLRTDQGLSLSELSRRSDVAKSTLSRWESGANEPDIPTLELVLEALKATDEERARALAMITAPRARAALREFDRNDGQNLEEIGSGAPAMGDALRAMRTRTGMTPEELAARVGVERSAVSLWESGRRVPNSHTAPAIADALNATQGERDWLVLRRRPQTWRWEGKDGLAAWLEDLAERLSSELAVDEFEASCFESEAWLLAQRDTFGAALLGQYHNLRAGMYCEAFAVSAVRRHAVKARDLPYDEGPLVVSHVPESCLAWVDYGLHGTKRLAGWTRRLESCFGGSMGWYQEWSLHLFLAKFYAEQGRIAEMEHSLNEAEHLGARREVDASQDLLNAYTADCLCSAGLPEQALKRLPEQLPATWAVPAQLESTRANAMLALGELYAAQSSIERLAGWIGEKGVVTVELSQSINGFCRATGTSPSELLGDRAAKSPLLSGSALNS